MTSTRATAQDLRRANRAAVLRPLLLEGPQYRLGLARRTGLSSATVTNVISELLDEALVVEAGVEESDGGRPRVLLRANPDFGVVIGEKDCWGRGIARETLTLVLRRAAALGLRKVLLEVASDNPRAIELYRRAGFDNAGVLRRHLPRSEAYVDVLIMAVFLA